jgi:hypothetical protein
MRTTSNEQTTKLISLGFPEPKTISETVRVSKFDEDYLDVYNYSIDELLEFLPESLTDIVDGYTFDCNIKYNSKGNYFNYIITYIADNKLELYSFYGKTLIDVLVNALVLIGYKK